MRAAIALLFLTGVASADGVRFEARVSSENVTLDQTVELTVSLERDGNQTFEAFRPPNAGELELLHSGTTQSMQVNILNGRQSVRVVEEHQYLYRAPKRGTFTISPATVRVGGQQLSTRPITIHVAPPSKNALTPAAPLSGTPPPPSIDVPSNEDVFVDARCEPAKAVIGQEVVCAWRLFTRSDILKYRPVTEPKHEDFLAEELYIPQGYLNWDRQAYKGRDYAVALLMKKSLFPLKAGVLTVAPLVVEATTMESAFYPNGSAVRRGPALTVDVREPPREGRPVGFQTVNVGQVELVASADKLAINADQSVTLKVTVRGSGNVRGWKVPRLESAEGWKVYDPTAKDDIRKSQDGVHGERVFTYLLLPQKGGALTIPPLAMPYFDPASGKFEVTKTAPISVTVTGTPSLAPAVRSIAPTENVLGQAIRPIRNRNKVHDAIGESLWQGRRPALVLGIPPALWLAMIIGDLVRRRLQRETPGSKRRRARRAARKRLRVAEYHIKAQRPSAFFGECARALYEHLEFRLGQKMEAYTLAELRGQLTSRGFSSETATSIVQELEQCDFARFAPSAQGPGEMRAALRRVKTLLEWIEQAKLPGVEKEKEAA